VINQISTKRYQRNLVYTLITVACVFLGFNSIPNLLVDPYDVFGTATWRKRDCTPNTVNLKVNHLLALNRGQKQAIQGFIVGTSRSNYYQTSTATSLSGVNYYNFNTPADNSVGIRNKAEWLIKTFQPQEIIVALDYDLNSAAKPKAHWWNLPSMTALTAEPPAISKQSDLTFYASYLPFQLDVLQTCLDLQKGQELYKFDAKTGHFWSGAYDKLRADPNRYQGKRFTQLNAWEEGKPVKQEVDTIEQYQSILETAKAYQVKVTFLINPINQNRFNYFDREQYQTWLSQVVEVTGGVWDFSGWNLVTTDDRNYYDTSHFTEDIGAIVLAHVFNKPEVNGKPLPKNFGQWVTPQNLSQRLAELDREYDVYAQANSDLLEVAHQALTNPASETPDTAANGASPALP